MTIYSMSWRQLGIAALAAIGMTFCLPAAAQSDADEGEEPTTNRWSRRSWSPPRTATRT